MVAPPYAGHLNPLLVIAAHLRTRGAQATFVTGPAKVATCRALGFEAVPVLAGDPQAMERIADTDRVTGHPLRTLRQVRANLRLLPRVLGDLQAAADLFRPDAIIADFCAPVAGVVANRLGVPWITTIPTPFAIENRRGTPAYCGGWTPRPGPLGTLRDAAGRTSTRALKRLTGALFRGELRAFGGSLYRPDGSEAFYSDQAIWALGLEALEFDRDWPDAVDFIGPITSDPTSRLAPTPPARRGDRSRVLVTLGTHLPWAKAGLVDQVSALAERLPGHDFVVACGDASGGSTGARAGPTVEVVPWLPYDDALPAFDAVIHHGGAGITYSTLRAGLPCLVWPHDYDQFDFAARIEHHGLGLRIRRLSDAVTGLPRALAAPRTSLEVFAGLVRASDPLAAAARTLDELTAG